MRKYTRKELKNMVALGMAEDVTRDRKSVV